MAKIVKENVTLKIRAGRSMSSAMAWLSDRGNWPLAGCCKAYRFGLHDIEIDVVQFEEWTDDEIEECRKTAEDCIAKLPRPLPTYYPSIFQSHRLMSVPRSAGAA